MPELRHDPIQKRWVIISTQRALRPDDFFVSNEHPRASFCPFDEGHEDKTPPEIAAIRDGSAANRPGWKVRVVPNRFAALKIEGDLDRQGMDVYDKMNGVGAHEVIIETPEHEVGLAEMPIEQLCLVLTMYRERLRDLMRDRRLKYVLLFKNHGFNAGATLAHPHTQIIATPVTPKIIANELQSAQQHFLLKERCLFCDVITSELNRGERIVRVTDDYVVLAPYASRFPFEIFVAPRRHRHDFAAITDIEILRLAETMKDIMHRLKVALKDPPYNFVIHTIPNVAATRRPRYWETLEDDFHWHIEILPRLTRMAGFEWGTGFYINPTPPEDCARFLRDVEI